MDGNGSSQTRMRILSLYKMECHTGIKGVLLKAAADPLTPFKHHGAKFRAKVFPEPGGNMIHP